jgi:hypothetical protein
MPAPRPVTPGGGPLWPPDLFGREAQALLDAIPVVNEEDMRGLLEEAFAEGRAAQLLTETGERDQDFNRWGDGAEGSEPLPLQAWPETRTRYLLCRDDCTFS